MPDFVSVTSRPAGSLLLAIAAANGSAISDEAYTVRDAARAVRLADERSQALFGEKAEAISRIWEIASECSDPDWDGDGAAPSSIVAALSAEAFVRALPRGLPLPEPAPEPDGSISLDWIPSRHRMLSISVGDSIRLAYAWLDGADRGRVVARFDGIVVPRLIVEAIRSVVRP